MVQEIMQEIMQEMVLGQLRAVVAVITQAPGTAQPGRCAQPKNPGIRMTRVNPKNLGTHLITIPHMDLRMAPLTAPLLRTIFSQEPMRILEPKVALTPLATNQITQANVSQTPP
jgi:hypothetical protein